MTVLSDTLIARELVERQPDPLDRRMIRIAITDSGRSYQIQVVDLYKNDPRIFKRTSKSSSPIPLYHHDLFMPIVYLIIFGNCDGRHHYPRAFRRVAGRLLPRDTPFFASGIEALSHFQPQKTKPPLFDAMVYSDETQSKNELTEGRIPAVVVFPMKVSNDHGTSLSGRLRLHGGYSPFLLPNLS